MQNNEAIDGGDVAVLLIYTAVVKEHKSHRPKTGTPSACRDVTRRIKLGLASQRISELACGDFSKYVCGGWGRPDLKPGVQAEGEHSYLFTSK